MLRQQSGVVMTEIMWSTKPGLSQKDLPPVLSRKELTHPWFMVSYTLLFWDHILNLPFALIQLKIIDTLTDLLSLCSRHIVKISFQCSQLSPLHLPPIPAPRGLCTCWPFCLECSCHTSSHASSILSFSFQLQYPLLRQASLVTFWAQPLTPFHQICHIIPFCSLHNTICNHLASSRVCLFSVDHLCISTEIETLAVLISTVSPGPRVVPGTQWCSVNISWVNK